MTCTIKGLPNALEPPKDEVCKIQKLLCLYKPNFPLQELTHSGLHASLTGARSAGSSWEVM